MPGSSRREGTRTFTDRDRNSRPFESRRRAHFLSAKAAGLSSGSERPSHPMFCDPVGKPAVFARLNKKRRGDNQQIQGDKVPLRNGPVCDPDLGRYRYQKSGSDPFCCRCAGRTQFQTPEHGCAFGSHPLVCLSVSTDHKIHKATTVRTQSDSLWSMWRAVN